MERTILILCAAPFLTVPVLAMPAFAGSPVVIDKPIVVAEGGEIRVKGTGDRDRHRDQHGRRDRGDHAEIVIGGRRHHHHDR